MRRYIASMDKPLLIASVAMLIFGLLMIFSASNAMSIVEYNQPYKYLIRQGAFLIVGILIIAIIVRIPTKRYYKLSMLVLVFLVALLVGVDIFGAATRSAKSWIPIGPVNIQPSEFCKMAIIMYMASHYEKVVSRNKMDLKSATLPLLVGLLCVALTAVQPDFGTAIIILGIVVLTFISIPLETKLKHDIYKIGVGAAVLVFLMLLIMTVSGSDVLSTKLERFNFLNPCTRYQESSGYQVCNGYIAINNGGLTGVGLGNSTQKYLYLPESHTDFIFPVVVEEWGLIGGVIILLMYIFIITRILIIAKRSVSLRGSIIAYGVATYLFMHIVINLTGVLGIAPLTGVPLPFLSYGGSNLWTLIIGLAMVQRVEIERNEYLRQNIIKKSII